jgi:cytochrome c oxidase cbb3-type subunit III
MPLYLAGFALCAAAAVFAQEAPASGRVPGSQPNYPPETVNRGRAQFEKNCSFCHGAAATGTSNGPNLILSAIVRHDQNGNSIGPVVRQGRPDRGMPAFNLSDSEISDIVAFLHARMAASDLRSATRSLSDYALDKLLTGKPEAGRAFFFGAGKCSTCHSPTGDLAGIAKRYPPQTLETRMLYPQDSHQAATVTDKSGRDWKGSIVLLTNFDVAIRDSAGWYRSWSLDSVRLKIDDPLAGHLMLLSQYSDAEIHDVFAYLETLK